MDVVHPSGRQYEIQFEAQRAVIVEVGGGVRVYRHGERDVLDPYDVDEFCPGYYGKPLIPWPNRIADGIYRFDGKEYRVALNDRANALHGLLQWRAWECRQLDADRVVMGTCLYPMDGYPFALDVEVAYGLGPHGLTVVTTARNVGREPCPYASGHHPYLATGGGLVNDCQLRLQAGSMVIMDQERGLPGELSPVTSDYDFAAGRRLGDVRLGMGFTDLARDDNGFASVELTGVDGSAVRLSMDASYRVVQVWTGDLLEARRARRALAVEPMTCLPNEPHTGSGLVRLEPGSEFRSAWSVHVITA